MDPTEAVRRITARDYSVQRQLRTVEPGAVLAIAPLLRHEDERVRTLAAHCLGVVGGTEAAHALVEAVVDSSLTVAAAALTALEGQHLRNMSGITDRLLGWLECPIDPMLRHRIPFVLLHGGAAPSTHTLKKAAGKEEDPAVKEGLMMLLADLGDKAARETVCTWIKSATGEAVRRWTKHLERMNKRWLVRPLLSWLDKEEPALSLDVDGMRHLPKALRACDLSVKWLVALTQVRPTFALRSLTHYTPQQRGEVRKLVEGWLAGTAGMY